MKIYYWHTTLLSVDQTRKLQNKTNIPAHKYVEDFRQFQPRIRNYKGWFIKLTMLPDKILVVDVEIKINLTKYDNF